MQQVLPQGADSLTTCLPKLEAYSDRPSQQACLQALLSRRKHPPGL